MRLCCLLIAGTAMAAPAIRGVMSPGVSNRTPDRRRRNCDTSRGVIPKRFMSARARRSWPERTARFCARDSPGQTRLPASR